MKFNLKNMLVYSSIAYINGYILGKIMLYFDTPPISIVIVCLLAAFVVWKGVYPKFPFYTKVDK